MNEPPVIDHNPNEKRPGWGIWWAAWSIVAVLWIAQWLLDGFVWDQIALGGFTGCLLTAWAMELTGGKVPDWMKSAPPRRRP